MTFVLVLVLLYALFSLIILLGLDDKRPLSKEVERLIHEKIKTGISVSFDRGRSGWIYTYPNKLRFSWFPFLIRYTFDDLGWIPFWSPLARELKKREMVKDGAKKLTRYGLGDET